MPELPEVQTVISTLERQLGYPVIKKVDVYWDNIISMNVENFKKNLEGQKIVEYGRRGKYLIFTLTDYILIAHLRMEGKFYIYKDDIERNKHTHVIFTLDNGFLHYNDVRKFGRFYLYKKGEALEAIAKLGLEPFDENLTASYLKNYCRKLKTPIKTQLLDQSMICGIGNIYADEICFGAGLNPETACCLLSLDKWQKVIDNCRVILQKAIEAGGTTIRSYTSSLGVTGLFQLNLNVHTRENEQCYKCGSIIKKIRLNGRGTYFCPKCQSQKALLVGITGSIGSGKSTLTSWFKENGYSTISCDEINGNLLNLDSTKAKLAEIFACKPEMVDKNLIRSKIFSSLEMKNKVETCLHGLIGERIKEFYLEHINEKAVIIEVPLLFESNWYKGFDFNVVVELSDDLIYKRLSQSRNMSKDDVDKYLSKQIPTEVKIKLADMVISNNSTYDNLLKEVEKAEKHIVQLL